MTSQLYTKKDLCQRWQLDIRSIDRMISEGVLKPCKDIKGVRFTPEHIAELEGIKLDKMSPIERKRLTAENEKLQKENEELKSAIKNILQQTIQYVKF